MKQLLTFTGILLLTISSSFQSFGQCEIYNNPETYIQDAQDYIYYPLRGQNQRAEWAFGDCGSDDSEAGGEPGGFDQPAIQDIDNFDITLDNYELHMYWYNAYFAINYANWMIENASSLNISQDGINNYLGFAYFYRAFYYFNLIKNFGEVPLHTEFVYNGPNNQEGYYTKARDTESDVWQQIEMDLAKAVNFLPVKSAIPTDDKYHISKGAAQAMLVKSYIYQEKWSDALTLAETIISSGEYELADGKYVTAYSDTTPAYRYIFTHEGEHNSGSIFEIECSYESNQFMLGTTSMIQQYQLPRRVKFESGKFGYIGWGFNCPSDELVAEYEPGDPRLELSIAQWGDSIMVDTVTWALIDTVETTTGNYSKKYWTHPKYKNPNNYTSDINIKVIRYADLLLWAAEAAYHLGQENDAMGYVNQVRERARNSGYTGQPADLTSITLEDIYHERRVELALEGHRLYDLRRWNLCNEEMADIGFVQNKQELFPIPSSYIRESEGLLTQNSGYGYPEMSEPPKIVNPVDDLILPADFGDGDTISFDMWEIFEHSSYSDEELSFGAYFQHGFFPLRTSNDGRILKIFASPGVTIDNSSELDITASVGSYSKTEKFIVQSANDTPPVVANPVEDLFLDVDAAPYSINLNNVFYDPQDTLFMIFQLSNSNEDLICLDEQNKILTLYVKGGTEGFSDISFTASYDGYPISDTFRVYVGYEKPNQLNQLHVDESSVQLYPNPAQNIISLENLPANENLIIDIYTISGEKVFSQTLTENAQGKLTLEVNQLNEGIYFLCVKNEAVIHQQKFVITRN